MATLVQRITDLATRIATELKSHKILINNNATDLSALTTTTKTDLVSAINEVRATAASSGTGDMKKSDYDTNNNGRVDRADLADVVPWAGVTGTPASYPPSAHDASLVTSGVFDIARIPVLPSQKQIASTGAIADLTTAQQNDIGQGTIVTTIDGQRWVYKGSGSKTLEASYITLADVTPEWTAIANKPTTLAGYGITDAQGKSINLTSLAGLASAVDKIPYFTDSAGTMSLSTFTSFGRSLVAAADAAAGRTALALGTIATYAYGDLTPIAHVGSGGTAHSAATTATAGFMSATDKSKLDGVATGANNYVHPTGDGNLHVPATGTTSNGKVLKAGSTAGSITWAFVDWAEIINKPSTFPPSTHTHVTSDVTGLDTALAARVLSADIGNPDTNFVTTFNAGL